MNRLGIAISITLTIVLLYALVAVVKNMGMESKYQNAYDETTIGEPLNLVLLRFGEPSDVAGRIQPGDSGRMPPCDNDCWLRLWYMAPILGGVSPYSVDFDINQKVIDKYQWSSP